MGIMNNPPGRFAKRVMIWIGQRALWFWINSLIPTAAMAYLFNVAGIAQEYAPFSYGVVALATFLIICIGYAIYAWGHAKWMLTRFEERRSQSSPINPLAGNFRNVRVQVSDFYHPFFRKTTDAKFENCELYGPAYVFIEGCTLSVGEMHQCEVVIARPDRPTTTVTVFKNCLFTGCSFYRITWIMTYDHYTHLPEEIQKGLTVISDGRVGDI
jgi:hypothetical protein